MFLCIIKLKVLNIMKKVILKFIKKWRHSNEASTFLGFSTTDRFKRVFLNFFENLRFSTGKVTLLKS